MGELKAFNMPQYAGKFTMHEVYLKSEADKVIADKDEKIAELEMKLARAQLVLRLNEPKALYSDLEIMCRLRHKIDVVERREYHQKHKRCLAMADFCSYKAWYYKYNGKEEIFYRWMKFRRVWAELAKKFK